MPIVCPPTGKVLQKVLRCDKKHSDLLGFYMDGVINRIAVTFLVCLDGGEVSTGFPLGVSIDAVSVWLMLVVMTTGWNPPSRRCVVLNGAAARRVN